MWTPYVPAASGCPCTFTAWVTANVVFSFAPARHGQLEHPLKPRSDIPQGTSSPQILPRRSFLPRTTRGLERDPDRPDRLRDGGLGIVSAWRKRQTLRPENEDGEPEERDERQEPETNAACHK